MDGVRDTDNSSPQFYDADGAHHDGPPILSPEERTALTNELQKTEEEITTLRQVLAARIRHAGELKRRLGMTPWREMTQDLRQTQAYQRTEELLKSAGEKTNQALSTVGKKIGDMRNSSTFKSFEDRVGSTYNSVKAKIAASASMDFGGHQQSGGDPAAAARSVPTTPAGDKKPPMA